MKSCDLLVDAGRRRFLSGAGVAAAGAAATGVLLAQPAKATTPTARITYPRNWLVNLKDLKPNEPFDVACPDADAPGVLIKLGKPVPGGAGPDGDIVGFSTAGPDGDIIGFSTACPHKGFPLHYNAERRTLNCPSHSMGRRHAPPSRRSHCGAVSPAP